MNGHSCGLTVYASDRPLEQAVRTLPAVPFEASAATAVVTAAATTTSATAAAVVASASAPSAAATRIASAASAAVLAGTGLVDDKVSAVVLGAVELGDGRSSLVVRGHFYKSKSARPSCLAVHHNISRLHGPSGRKMLLEVLARHPKRQITDVKFSSHFLYFGSKEAVSQACELVANSSLASKQRCMS